MADSQRLWQSICDRFGFLREYFHYDPEKRKLLRKYKTPKGLKTARSQYGYFRWRFPGDVLFFQVGRFFEFYGYRDRETVRLLGLRRLKSNRRGAQYGFPVELARQYARILLKRGHSILVILQTDHYWTGIRERRPAWRLVPC